MINNLYNHYFNLKSKIETFLFNYILPPIFKVMVIGLQVILVWALYQALKNSINELFK